MDRIIGRCKLNRISFATPFITKCLPSLRFMKRNLHLRSLSGLVKSLNRTRNLSALLEKHGYVTAIQQCCSFFTRDQGFNSRCKSERIDALMKEVIQLIPCEYAFSLLQDNGWHCNYPIYENLHVQQMGHFSHEIISSYSSDVGL